MFRSRQFYLSLVGVVAGLTTAADTIFSVIDAASLSTIEVPFASTAVAASVFDVVGLCGVALFSTHYIWKREGLIKQSKTAVRALVVSCVLFSIIALCVSLASIITTKRRLREVTTSTKRTAIHDWNSYLAVEIAVWVLACLSQVALYSVPLWNRSPEKHVRSVQQSDPRDSVMSEVRHSNQTANLFMLEPTQPASPLAGLPSPTFSSRSSQSLKSWRDSLHQVVRPVTSRTKLIGRPSLTRDSRSIYSDGQSVDNVSHSDGFETWDTSSVDTAARDAVLVAPSRGTALEPIPGSRPASPARALDGPFRLEDDEDMERALSPPPRLLPDTSRPPSPVVSEANIHPLFRSESPVPPPAVTPGTNIEAAPMAQMIACPARTYSRMRSNSRTASPSPLVHSRSFHDRAISPQGSSRSPSPSSRPASRGMTPPIPDFVLNSSPRSSMSGSISRKKVNLHLDTGRTA
ncbi:hypothetical protein K491DRAFT_19108 [Lophiostoma macrostomum CBS 122681]|uniref:Uncharacterized protein n=1 Tax=Lophiostoma macrostomum CBS 122681 TaxID=1314788 RepID=A0A6A6TNF5_9PLEO|nr:hypothetical protein K491DRAFT_19108 [Lophiostoma macrostomum CBS 122681]